MKEAETPQYRSGICVVFLGPDGAGKSSVVQLIADQPPDWCTGVVVRHLKPSLLRRRTEPATDPHALPPRGLVMSLAKCLYWLAEYMLGYWLRVRPELKSGKLVLFDRYMLDTIVDSRRYRYGGPSWLLRLLWRIVPKPDVIVLLDAPLEVLAARKQEVTLEELARQLDAYRTLVANEPRGCIVDASATPEDVVSAVLVLLEAGTSRHLRQERPAYVR